MKKIQNPILIYIGIFYLFTLALFGFFSQKQYLEKNDYLDINQTQLEIKYPKALNLDFLLKYSKSVVVAYYFNSDDVGLYDPSGRYAVYFSYLDKNKRYFSKEDYHQKTPVYIQYVGNLNSETSENNIDKNNINVEYALSLFKPNTNQLNQYRTKNLLANTNNIQKIIVYGEEKDDIVKELKKLDFTLFEPPYYSLIEIFDSQKMTHSINLMLAIFFLINFIFIPLFIFIKIDIHKNAIKTHRLYGLSYFKYWQNYLILFMIKTIILLVVIQFLFQNFSNVPILNTRNSIELFVFNYVYPLSIFLIISTYYYWKKEV